MKRMDKKRLLTVLLMVLIVALVSVIGYVILREYQYGVSDEYYDSLRKTGLVKGAWKA